MSSPMLEVKERLLQVQGGVDGLAGPGGGRHHRTDTTLKRRSSEMTSADAEKAKRMRRQAAKHGSRRKRKRTATLTNNAPFNSTQFLMSDHGGDTIQYLDTTLGVSKSEPSAGAAPVRRVTRARESSFSLDSDEDFYYSSPEDEEEFVSQEFMKEYNRMKECVRTDRLVDMSKTDLIQEYLQMEQRVDSLEKRLNRHKGKPEEEDQPQPETDSSSCSDSKETTEQIRLFQREILRLEAENERLRSANVVLLQQKKAKEGSEDDDDNSSCSTCSSSSSSSSDSSSSEDEEDEPLVAPQPPPAEATKAVENDRDDTGYESSHSGSTKKVAQEGNNDETVSSSTNST